MDLFSDEARRNPFPIYAQLRAVAPVFRIPPPFDAWAILDYDGVRRSLADPETFSSRVDAPRWFIFEDAPVHTKLRGLISRAFTPRMLAGLESRIREVSRGLLDHVVEAGEMDVATDYAVPLPMTIIAEMIGMPAEDWPTFKRWSDVILDLSHTRSGIEQKGKVIEAFRAVTQEMDAYLAAKIDARQSSATAAAAAAAADDLLARLVAAEVDGQRLTRGEILGFFQLLILAGQETTTNLINNAVLCLLENPDQLALLRANPALLPQAIEEVLRVRPSLLWTMRTPRRDVEFHGQVIPAGQLVLQMIGSANRDPAQFPDPERFDITRDPNPHLSFGLGSHFCLGASLARMEARIALADILERLPDLRRASDDPWPPRRAFHVHGPASLPVRFRAGS